MAGVNKAFLIGNLGADPETRTSNGGLAITNLRIATSERRKSGGEWTDHTEWHRVVLFGKTAEFASEWLRKGSKVWIEGRISTSKWQDKDGNDRYTTEIICDRFENLTPREGNAPRQQQTQDKGLSTLVPAGEQQKPDFNDDIPF